MSKLSKYNDGFKVVMVVIDILYKYAWLELLKSRQGILTKNTLEHIFSEIIRFPEVIQMDKETELFNALVKTCLADNNIKLFATHNDQKTNCRKVKRNHQQDHVSVFHKEKHKKVY